MKTLLSISCFLLLSTINIISYSQNITASNITHNSAIISFPNAAGESLNLHVYTKSIDDTIVFFEDFSKLPKLYSSISLFGSQVALNIPNSYTLRNGCQARKIYSTNKDTCYFISQGEFITPFIDLSKTNGNFRVKCNIKNLNTSSANNLRVYQSDSLGAFSNFSTITIPKNSSKNYDTIFTTGIQKGKLKLFSNSSNIAVDNFSISYTYTNKIPLNFSPLNSNSNSITINNLEPNKAYYCYIQGRTDTICFRTLDKIKLEEVSKICPNSATIKFISTDTISSRKLIIRKKSTYQNVFSDDLFFSEYTTAHSSNRAIEIYNGTGLDMSLKDYSIYINIFSGASNIDTTFNFSEYDTIKSNSCVVLTEKLESLNTQNEGIFFWNSATTGQRIFNGNDAIVLMKDSNYIDIFGCIGQNPGTGWVYGTGDNQLQTNISTLRRLSSVNKGVKTNPASGFPTLGTEWAQIGADGSVLSSTFEDFGRHTMDNAIGAFDSLAFSINLGLKDTTYYIDELEEGTLYEAYLVIANGLDSVVSKSISFKTGVNTLRLSNGYWNDNNWSKGIPTENDNAIINYGQKIIVPNNYNANCLNLILKDSLNQTKTSFINNGAISTQNKTIVEKYIKGYTSNSNGWNLMGVPINVNSSNQDTIGYLFFNPATNDDLYYWQEDYTDIENNGRWINWKDIPLNSGDFFINSRGYLVSYLNNTKLNFYGDLNNEDSYSILNNASLSSPNNLRGWHLCSNPYPFYLKINNLQRTNISLPSLLDTETSNYTALIQGDSIPPFAGFMVQVSNTNNSLDITKVENSTKSLIDPNIITINVSSPIGNDRTRLILMDSVSMGYDVEYDNRKLSGYALSPEIFSVYNNEKYSVNAIPRILDSLILDINFNSKSDNNYTISLDIDDREGYEKIALFNKLNNTELIDFLIDSSYTFHSPSNNNPDMFILKIFKDLSSLEVIKGDNSISVKQHGNKVSVISNTKITKLELTNLKGQSIKKNLNSNSIIIPQKGVFVLTISTENQIYQQKIIYL